MMRFILLSLAFIYINNGLVAQDYYFPPVLGQTWETVEPSTLNWCEERLDSLKTFLEESNSKSFIVLKDGKIAIEYYMNGHGRDSVWYWASAGKTVSSTLIGLAQEEGYLNIDDKSSDYLGKNWTSLDPEKEDLITVRHQLSMTTGMNDLFFDCTTPECLRYVSDAGKRWSYQNGPYTLLRDVLEEATGNTSNQYTINTLTRGTGMTGIWLQNGVNHLFWSNARSAARFGSLIINKGMWDGNAIITDTSYLNAALSPSQTINKSYGYLWWLNGKESFMLPASQSVTQGTLVPSAPKDMVSALGKNGQIVSIIPSTGMVVIRFGDSPSDDFVPTTYVDELWDELNAIFCTADLEEKTENEFFILPSPASNSIEIKTKKTTKIEHVEVLDIQGKIVLNTNEERIDISNLLPGIYLTRASFENGNTAMKRWVKHE